MDNIPKKIYLQVNPEDGDEVTWSAEKIFDNDVCYYRDLYVKVLIKRYIEKFFKYLQNKRKISLHEKKENYIKDFKVNIKS